MTASGRFVALDAAETMAAFMLDGQIDREAFRELVGGLLCTARESGRSVRAYGEMVALLWDAGDVLAAIELERLWNELGRKLQFSLFCSYPVACVSRSEHAEALHEVCHLHSCVLNGGSGELSDPRRSIWQPSSRPSPTLPAKHGVCSSPPCCGGVTARRL